MEATNLFMLAWPWISTVQMVMYRHYVHTCLIIIGSDDSCWSWHIQLNNGLQHINTFNLYITHTGYHSEIHVYTICYQVHAGSSTKSKLSAILITLLGVFTSQLLNWTVIINLGQAFFNSRGTFSVDLPSISPAQKS